MTLNLIIKIVKKLDDNFCLTEDDIYISIKNMKKFTSIIDQCDEIQTLLITPYLIDIKSRFIYELHYYEFVIEISDIEVSKYIDYNINNSLPIEITNNLKPKALIRNNDKYFYINAIKKYLELMEKMKFEEDINLNKSLIDYKLYYQLF